MYIKTTPRMLCESVLLSLLVTVLDRIIYQEICLPAWTAAGEHELWTNFTRAMESMETETQLAELEDLDTLDDEEQLWVASDELNSQEMSPMAFLTYLDNILNQTAPIKVKESSTVSSPLPSPAPSSHPSPTKTASSDRSFFYFSELPRVVFVYLFLLPAEHYIQVLLESLFPTRPRRKAKSHLADVDDRTEEEETVKRWVAEGKVREARSWRNTLYKWVLDAFLGRGVYMFCSIFLNRMSRGKFGEAVQVGGLELLACVSLGFGQNVVSGRMAAELLALVFVPVQQRLFFVTRMMLCWRFCFSMGFTFVKSLAAQNDLMQDMFGFAIEQMAITVNVTKIHEP